MQPEHPAEARRVRVLPDDVVNKIAAGEVIERPAAVVKELLENALDAGASRVEVEFRHGGKSYIRVEDNGCGMSPDEALLALERHATSKLQSADDLLRIVSMGFRGEALPSIASVARFTLRTRPAKRDAGTELLVNGGKLLHVRDCGMAPGSRIEVAQLFGPVPARRKFLKTDNTEAAHIVQLVRLYAIARPEVDFTLVENDRVLFKSPRGDDLKHRVQEIWGRQLAEPLEVLPPVRQADLHLSGLLGRPGSGRSTRREMITLVNQRPVDSRTLNYALIEAYHTFIPKGRYPLAFLFLEIDPAAIDVNVHPAKREIRFRDEGQVRRFVLEAVAARLTELARGQAGKPPDAAAQAAESIITARQAAPRPSPPAPASRPQPTIRPQQPPAASAAIEQLNRSPLSQPPPASAQPPPPAPGEQLSGPPREEKELPERQHKSLKWRQIGRLQEGQALFETEAGLVVLDVRSAHQRVWFERIEAQFTEGVDVQRLLFPLHLELDPLGAVSLLEHLDFFRQHGFDIETFGRNFFRIEGHPAWLRDEDTEAFVLDLVAAMREGRLDPKKPQPARQLMAKMAATRAVRLNELPGDETIHQLAADLLACRQPLVCPQGRPTYFEVPRREIAKRLGR